MKRIEGVVIGSRQDFELYREDIERQDGLVFARSPGGSRGGVQGGEDGLVRRLDTLWDALRAYLPGQALFLSPYRDMAADAAHLLENGVNVRSAGPLPFRTRDPGIPVVDIHRSDTGFPAMIAASRHADFGVPVYLRLISSPEGGKWQKWWCVFQSCRKAAVLLDSPMRRVYVAAAGTEPRLHVSVTLRTDRDSTGHLLVAPNGSRLQDDLFLVGTGGTLSDDPLLNQPGMYGKSDYRMLTRPTQRRLADLWGDDALIILNDDERRFYHDLLRAMGDSSRSRTGICLEYPEV